MKAQRLEINRQGFVGIIILVLSLAVVGILVFLNWNKIDDQVRGGRENVNERAQEKIDSLKEQIDEVQEKLNHAQDKIKDRLEE